MKFERVGLETLLGELTDLPAEWMDDQARQLIACIHASLGRLRETQQPVTADALGKAFAEHDLFLDVCRLLHAKGQEPFAHDICAHLDLQSATWARLRKQAQQEPQEFARVMVKLGLPQLINDHLGRQWGVEDILIERYKMSRGRAITGQRRGRALEEAVAEALKRIDVPYQRNVAFIGKAETAAKCDFAIPSRDHPKIVMEVKGFEATGSKLTDFLGDVLKIGQAKEYHTYFFIVTDGRGWYNRQSDLKKLVRYHKDGLIDMIYTQARISELAENVKHIYENE